MISTIASVLLLLYALNKYNKGRYAWPLLAIVFFASNAFIINLGDAPVVKYKDFGLILLSGCCLLARFRDQSFFRLNHSMGATIAAAFLLFFAVEFVYAVLTGVDTVGNIMAVSRDYLYALSFFVFRKAPYNELRKGMSYIFKLCMLSCTLFVLQYFTHIPLVNTFIAESATNLGVYRMQVTPPLITLFLLSFLLFIRCGWKKWTLTVCLLFAVMLISQNRTPLIGLFLQIGLFLLLGKNVKNKVPIMMIALVAFPFVNAMFESRQKNETSSFDVPVIQYISQGDYQGLSMQNSFMYRIAMLAERTDFVFSNPEYLLLGVGPMHEETAQRKLDFKIGTANISSAKVLRTCQLDSPDIEWSPMLIRYGLVGLFVHLVIMIQIVFAFYKRRADKTMMLGFLIYVSALAQSFSSAGMFGAMSLTTMMAFLIIYDKGWKAFK